MRSATHVDTATLPRNEGEVVVAQLQRQVVVIDLAVYPNVTGYFLGEYSERGPLERVSEFRHSVCAFNHGNKEIVIGTDHVIECAQIHPDEASIGEVAVLCFVEAMDECSFEGFDRLFDSVLHLGGLSGKGDDGELTITAKSPVVIVDHVGDVVAS